MFRITEAGRRFRLRIVLEGLPRGAESGRRFSFPASLRPTNARLARVPALAYEPSAIAFHHRQFRRRFRPLGKGMDALGSRVASCRQFAANVSHDALDRIVRDRRIAAFAQEQRGTLKRARLRRERT